MPSTSEHWDQIYTSRAMETLSWFEATPDLSLELVQTSGTPSPVIDVGAGESLLADELVALGVSDVTILDLSSAALDEVRTRVAPHSITTICADVLEWEPAQPGTSGTTERSSTSSPNPNTAPPTSNAPRSRSNPAASP